MVLAGQLGALLHLQIINITAVGLLALSTEPGGHGRDPAPRVLCLDRLPGSKMATFLQETDGFSTPNSAKQAPACPTAQTPSL